ncbi:hypothetical protein FHR97_003532 [Halomonas stenophila]|uniref:Uncharacterized protein n=1 Tax=Halomonas stenophila TaxID=795312 RepID=A0A7W5HMM0_9GAMM|nr:hypothetical protein [Halomonas stenophila]
MKLEVLDSRLGLGGMRPELIGDMHGQAALA